MTAGERVRGVGRAPPRRAGARGRRRRARRRHPPHHRRPRRRRHRPRDGQPGHPSSSPDALDQPTRSRVATRSRCPARASSVRSARPSTSAGSSAPRSRSRPSPAPRASDASRARSSGADDDGVAVAGRRLCLRRHREGPHGVRWGGPAKQADEEERAAPIMNFELMEALQVIEREKGVSDRHPARRARQRPRLGLQAHARRRRGGGRHHRPRHRRDPRLRPGARRGRQRHRGVGGHARATSAASPPRRPSRSSCQRIREAERDHEVRGVRRPRGRHRHRHHPADRPPLHAARPRQGRGACCPRPSRCPTSATSTAPGSRRTSSRSARPPRARRSSSRRTHPGLIKRLFELEVPEISDGVVELKAVAREPGHRTKIAVWSNDHNVDPVGACVGARGARVRMVVNELRGEKVDIVPFSEDPREFVMKALSPAKVKEVRLDEETGTAEVDRPRLPALAGHRQGGPERPPGRPPHRLARRHQERDPAGRGGGLRQPGLGRGRVGRERGRRDGVEAGRGRRGSDGRAWSHGADVAEDERRSRRRRSDEVASRESADARPTSGGSPVDLTPPAGRGARGRRGRRGHRRRQRPTARGRHSGTAADLRRLPAGRRRPATLVRVVVRPDGGLAAVGRTRPGRGAWLCRGSPACCRCRGLRRKAFGRAFRAPIGIRGGGRRFVPRW